MAKTKKFPVRLELAGGSELVVSVSGGIECYKFTHKASDLEEGKDDLTPVAELYLQHGVFEVLSGKDSELFGGVRPFAGYRASLRLTEFHDDATVTDVWEVERELADRVV